MLFLKSILDENEQSMVAKFFPLQLQQPIQGDWVSTCRNNLKEINIELTWNEIRMMSKENFHKMLKIKISEIFTRQKKLKRKGNKIQKFRNG